MNDFLKTRLRRVIRRQQWLRLSGQLIVCWTVAALLALALMWFQQRGWSSPFAFPLLGALAFSTSLVLWMRSRQTRPDEHAIAQQIERTYPELRGLLLTAVQQLEIPEKQLSFLQYRVTQQALDHSQRTRSWRLAVPLGKVRAANLAQLAMLTVFAVLLWRGGLDSVATTHRVRQPLFAEHGITITPGDTQVERGESLLVMARFGGTLPPGVDLVVNDAASPARKIPLVKSLGDPMFGGSVPEVANDFTYHLEYGGEHTRDFTVKVFEHPRLARSDVDLKYPDYTHLDPKHVEDTRRVSAVEGTQLGLTLQLNKPVTSAKLVARNKEKTEIPLTVVADKAVASLANFPLVASQTYELKLVDAEGRANKVPTSFVIDVFPNRRPELKLASPRGDVRPSALEEITFEGTVWDDFGSPAYGIAYTVAGQETKFLQLGRDVPAKEKKSFTHLVRLEELGVKPDDLVSWYVWADDLGPDGKLRRTSTDMYFAEVRPFEEIFREDRGMQQEQDGQQGQQGGGNEARRLTELEKQIINATWKLQRDPTSQKYADDIVVVRDSQKQALDQANEQLGRAFNPRQQALWTTATNQMEEAVKHLSTAEKSPKALDEALKAEQAAFQAVLKLQARETQVTRSRQRGQQGGQQGNQRQIDELDLEQSQNRYETQRQAKAPQSQQRQEQNQILNRLQELARRQQDVNERLKELQTSLQAARTEQEKEDLRRQLKRLQEEQQQMLADLDETRQRMERPENQSAMQQQREQLDQTRDELQKAADATGQGAVSQALASGTRAQRQLQQMRDDLRKQNSSEFADDLREMRAEARELARQQEDTAKKIQELDQPRRSLGDTPERKAALDQLAEEQKRMSDLLQRAQQVSEQADATEPLLSRQLYDSVRKISQDDAKNLKDFRQQLMDQGLLTRSLNDRLQQASDKENNSKSLDLTNEMLREGYLPQANQAAQRATESVNELKRGVERAAESVIGDDAEALKLAQSELEKAAQQLERELAEANGKNPPQTDPSRTAAGNSQQRGQRGQGRDPNATDRGNAPGQSDERQANNDQQGAASASPQPGQRQAGSAAGNQPSQRNSARQAGQRGDPANPGNRENNGQQVANNEPGSNNNNAGAAGQPGGGREGAQASSEQNDNLPQWQRELRRLQQERQAGERGDQQVAQNNQATGNNPGQSTSQPGANQAGNQPGGQPGGQRTGNQRGGNQRGSDARGGDQGERLSLDTFLDPRAGPNNLSEGADRGGGGWGGGPILGNDFVQWSDRLRNVEEILDQPTLRDAVANARERARLLRQEAKRDLKKPDWTVVQLQVLKPLFEVRSRVAEELARRDSKDPLVPIDRDPVPNRYAESVRKYYEELGKDK